MSVWCIEIELKFVRGPSNFFEMRREREKTDQTEKPSSTNVKILLLTIIRNYAWYLYFNNIMLLLIIRLCELNLVVFYFHCITQIATMAHHQLCRFAIICDEKMHF